MWKKYQELKVDNEREALFKFDEFKSINGFNNKKHKNQFLSKERVKEV